MEPNLHIGDNDRRYPASGIDLRPRWHLSGADYRAPGFDSGWTRFAATLITRIEGGDYRVDTEDGRTHHIPDGSGFVLPAGLARRARVRRDQTATTVYAHCSCRVAGALDLFARLPGLVPLTPPVAAEVARLNRAVAGLLRVEASLVREARLLALGGELLAVLLDALPELTPSVEPVDPRVLLALEHIEAHLSEPVARAGLARHCRCSVSRLHTLFKQALGVAPMDYLTRQRLARARRLLHESVLSIQAIADSCGYRDPFYFSRAFTRAEGCSPRAYRRRLRADAGA